MLCHGIKRNDEMLNKDDGSGVVQRRGIIQKYPGIELIGLGDGLDLQDERRVGSR